jgi:hypothetical protein
MLIKEGYALLFDQFGLPHESLRVYDELTAIMDDTPLYTILQSGYCHSHDAINGQSSMPGPLFDTQVHSCLNLLISYSVLLPHNTLFVNWFTVIAIS